MRVLILGYSSIVRRRVLAAARACAWIEGVELASRSLAGETPEPLVGVRTYADYATALEHSACEVVYVSLVNSAHDEWVRRALASGRHVIVDKPALSSVALAEHAVALAHRHGRVLAEATVWPHHPQVRRLLDAGVGVRRAAAVFCYPPLPTSDFRRRPELGGGALWDLGPYAVSVGRVLFDAEPVAVGAQVLAREGGVDTSFCMWADYGAGRGLTGLFGTDVAYANALELLTASARVRIERVFTSPPELENVIDIVEGQATRRLQAPAADSFAAFLTAVGHAIASADTHTFAARLLADARTLAQLRSATGACP